MLRHACGYALANRGTDTRTLQAYLGHHSIQSTVRYTELAPGREGVVSAGMGETPHLSQRVQTYLFDRNVVIHGGW